MPSIARRPKRIVEATIQDRIVQALSRMPDVVIHRNLVGTYETVKAGWIRAGLGPGTADLIGWVTIDCTDCDHVEHRKIARFMAIEVKIPGGDGKNKDRETEQRAWLDMVRSMGGVAEIVHSEAEAIAVVEEARRWLR